MSRTLLGGCWGSCGGESGEGMDSRIEAPMMPAHGMTMSSCLFGEWATAALKASD